MSLTALTCSFGPLVAAADEAELDDAELVEESLMPLLADAVISTLWFAYLVRSTSPDEMTVYVLGAEAEPVALISVKVNDLPSALGVRQPVTVCGAMDDCAEADGSVEGV